MVLRLRKVVGHGFFFSTFRLPQTLCSSYSTIYFFYIGEFNRNKLDGTETPIRVKRIVIHPGYDRYSMAHNIALLELENPVKLNDHIRMVSWRVVAIISRLFLLVVAFGINEDSWDGKSIELRCDRTFSAEKYKFAVSRMFMAHVYLLNKCNCSG